MAVRMDGARDCGTEGESHTAVPAGAGDPFDANSIAELQARRFSPRTEFDNLPHTLVAADLTRLSGERECLPLWLLDECY